ncbi:MAG: methionine adenosyltransferase [Dehalococcoidia bacterium]|nr:methionine adenosyltransferase [Dehalococcoidia bacterium]MDW8119607.1 methionine adenosyltransferase [Chloroflexota bacterium]
MSFFTSSSYLFTSESVTEGHPDKLCDQISDAVLDAYLAQDPYARVACEAITTRGFVLVMGEITSKGVVDVPTTVRQTLRRVGYTRAELGIGCDDCAVLVALQKQAPEIAAAVGQHEETDPSKVGAGDQGMMVGFACQEYVLNAGKPEMVDTAHMPLPIYMAHRLCRRLAEVRKKGILPYLRPDGKSQVTVEYAYGKVKRIHTVIIAAQHEPDIPEERVRQDVQEVVIRALAKDMGIESLLDTDTRFLVNTSGSFIIGGPAADSGLTGRKILVDTYGGSARHGGGSFSGKDPTKVDRSGAYGARYVARNIVAAGLAERCEVQVSYAIGRADPISISVETFGTSTVPDEVLERAVRHLFDLRPLAIIQHLDLRRPIYTPLAAYGHFGRDDLSLPWEQTDKVDALRDLVSAHRVRR